MKLRLAKASEDRIIYNWWKEIFSFDDGGYTDFYFQHLYPSAKTYVLADEKDELVSCLNVHSKVLTFNGDRFRASFIVGILTVPQHQHKGYMHELLNGVLEILSATELFTLIQAYKEQAYAPFGFEDAYFRRHYIIDQKHLPVMSATGVSTQEDPLSMKELYQSFTSHFSGSPLRSEADFKLLIEEVKAQKGRVITFAQDAKLKAYALIYPQTSHIDIDEIVYSDTLSLMTLLSTLGNSNPHLLLKVSQAEDLTRLLPHSPMEIKTYTSIRINDLKLFNDHFKMNVRSTKEALHGFKAPFWIRENT